MEKPPERPPMPPQPTTKSVDRMEVIQKQLERILEEQRGTTHGLATLHEDVVEVRDIVQRHERELVDFAQWRARVSTRVGTHSDRARETSQTDRKQDALIAQEKTDREAFQTKVLAELETVRSDVKAVTAQQTTMLMAAFKRSVIVPFVKVVIPAVASAIFGAIVSQWVASSWPHWFH